MGKSFDGLTLKDPAVGGSLLYAQNLLRIAALQQQLKNRPGEMAAWEELENFLRDGTLLSHFASQADLNQYIAERKKQL